MRDGGALPRESVVLPHPLRDVIAAAVQGKSKADVLTLAAAIRAVLKHSPDLDVVSAYDLVDRLWGP